MRGALVGQAKDDRDTSTDSSTRAGESAPAPLLGAAPRVEGPVELSNDPEPGLVTCERCGCECYDWVREWGGRVECLTCVLHDRDVARDAARIAGDALRARDAELDAERQRTATLESENERLGAHVECLRWQLAHK